MTCKDCKKYGKCEDAEIDIDESGDSLANWCDDFDTIHESKEVTYHGITACQTGYNWHVTLVKDDKYYGHASCNREMTEEELIDLIKMLEIQLKVRKDEREKEQ